MTFEALRKTVAAFESQPKPPDYVVETSDGLVTSVRFPAGMERTPRAFPLGSMVFTSQAIYDRVWATANPASMNAPVLMTGMPIFLVTQAEADEFLLELKRDILLYEGRRLRAQPGGEMRLLPYS